MAERDLIVGVLAVQAGFVSPAQLMAAALAWLADNGGEPLAARLEAVGVLSTERRKLIDAQADKAFAHNSGDAKRTIESLGGEAALSNTFGESLHALTMLRRRRSPTRNARSRSGLGSTRAWASWDAAGSRSSAARSTGSSAARWR